MQIVLVLAALAALALVTLGGILVGSLLLGGMMAATRWARIIAPVFLVVVPATVLGALSGAAIIGYLAVRANESLIVLGPLGGLVVGGVAGLSVGVAGALFWWWRVSRAARRAACASSVRTPS